MKSFIFIFIVTNCIPLLSYSTRWQVGASHMYTLPSQVSTLVQTGDTVDIDSGIYPSDVCNWQADNLLLRGIGGYAILESNGLSWGDKAIWVIQGNNTTVEFIEFTECTSTSQNGAGIRQEGLNLTVRHCSFHNNEDGILAGEFHPSTMIIEFCEFAYNGFGTGYSHNVYIGNIDTLIFRYNYSHHSYIGHELKSRAHFNYILYNRFSNEATGNASREIDLPNGGTSIIMGNIIQQGPNAQNSNLLGFGLEGLSNPVQHELYVVNNTFVNERPTGVFIDVQNGTSLVKAYNNLFAGPGTILTGSATVVDTAGNEINSNISSAGFVNSANYDYHLLNNSSAINSGVYAGSTANGFILYPSQEYLHPNGYTVRVNQAITDAGAFEYQSTSIIEENPESFKIISYIENNNLVIHSDKKIKLIHLTDLSSQIIFQQYLNAFDFNKQLPSLKNEIYLLKMDLWERSESITLKLINRNH